MKLTPIPDEFYIAVMNWPAVGRFEAGWYMPERPLRSTKIDALNDALEYLDPEDDYRILCINILEGTSRDVTEDAIRECDWTDPPLPDHEERAEAEREAEREGEEWAEHIHTERRIHQRGAK